MRTLVLALSTSTVAFAVLSAYLGSELSSLQAEVRSEREVRLAQARSLEALDEERARLAQRVARAQSAMPPPLAGSAGGGPMPAREGSDAGVDPRDYVGVARPMGSGPPRGMASPPLMLPQASRKFMALRSHGELFRELSLTPSERDAVLTALAEHEERAQVMFANNAPFDPSAPPDPDVMRERFEALRSEKKAAYAEALGARRAEQLDALEQTIPARMEIKQFRDHLEAVGVPLADAQRAKLVAQLTNQHEQRPPPVGAGEPFEEMHERYREWRSERSRLFREQAAAVLTPEQLEQLEQYHAWEATMGEALGAAGMGAVGMGAATVSD
jgi:hypothetical protein